MEGGLGIPKLEIWNKAAQLKHIWHLCKGGARGIWVDWVHAVFLKGRSFWKVKTPSHCSWTWRKLLKLRTSVRQFFFWKVGNGLSISLWSDFWLPQGPLDNVLNSRDIATSGLPSDARLYCLIEDSSWVLP